MINEWLSQISEIIRNNFWLAPLFALLAGLLTSFTPCSLSGIPLIIGYVGGVGEKNTKKALWYSVTFSVGKSITFIILGIVATSAGKLLGTSSPYWYGFLGVLMVVVALQVFGIINIIPSNGISQKGKKRGFIGAFLAGILGGVFSTPCSTPVLIALLAIVADEKSFLRGIMLMLMYSIGHSVLVIIAGTSVGFVQKVISNKKYETATNVIKYVFGIIILLISFYMFYLAF